MTRFQNLHHHLPAVLRLVAISAVLAIATTTPANAQDAGVPHCATTKIEVERLWCEGSAAFVQQHFAEAIGPYRRALELEKKQRVLGRNAWLVLIDDLGMAYGITGNLIRAREVFEYGISKEPNYPMFYYNMACASAESGDQAKSIDYLKRAFALRKNVIPGETMPDPATDDSFQRFMNDKAFVSALKSLPGRGE